MLPSCGLFSVNLLMKMSANDSNHLNKSEEVECQYNHCSLWLLFAFTLNSGKMSGFEQSFTLVFSC